MLDYKASIATMATDGNVYSIRPRQTPHCEEKHFVAALDYWPLGQTAAAEASEAAMI